MFFLPQSFGWVWFADERHSPNDKTPSGTRPGNLNELPQREQVGLPVAPKK